MILGHDLAFWFAAFGAAIVRVVLSPWVGAWKSLVSFGAAMFFALTFTDSVLDYLNLNPETYKIAVTVIVALTGESVARWGMQILADPTSALEWFRAWRGGGK